MSLREILKSEFGVLTAEADLALKVEAAVGRVLVGSVLDVVAVGEPLRPELGTVPDEGGQRLAVDLEARRGPAPVAIPGGAAGGLSPGK